MKITFLLLVCFLFSASAQTIDPGAVYLYVPFTVQVNVAGTTQTFPSNITTVAPNATFARLATNEIQNVTGTTFFLDNLTPAQTCLDQAGCSANALCSSTESYIYSCSCNAGYNDTSSEIVLFDAGGFQFNITAAGGQCTDIDECQNATVCGETGAGICTNMPGSYVCACNTGFTFDTVTNICIDNNECMNTTHFNNCSGDANCTNLPGSFVCTCLSGYTGDGITCAEFNECMVLNYTCGANGTCMNHVGFYNCSCDPGYEEDLTLTPIECVDTDECAPGGSNNCAPLGGNCTNIPESFVCSCLPGYTGNGTTCTNIDECADSTHTCDVNAMCSDTNGTFTCTCNVNFMGNGMTCTPVGMRNYTFTAYLQINTGTTNSTEVERVATAIVNSLTITYDNFSVAYLYNVSVSGGVQYVVRYTFVNTQLTVNEFAAELSGATITDMLGGVTPTVGDFNECVYLPAGMVGECDNNSICTNLNGSHSCACLSYYLDDSVNNDGTNCVYPVTQTCGIGVANVTIRVEYLEIVGVSYLNMALGNCTVGTLDSTNRTLNFFGSCGANSTEVNNTLHFAWSLTNHHDGITVIAERRIEFPITCVTPTNFTLNNNYTAGSDDNSIEAPVDTINTGVLSGDGFFRLLRTDSSFNGGATDSITTGSRLFFTIGSTDIANNVNVFVNRIVAVSPADPSVSVVLVDGGCPQSVDAINPRLTNNGVSNSVRAEFTAFTLRPPGNTNSNLNTVSLEIEVNTCLTGCAASCPAKKKRSIFTLRHKRQSDADVKREVFVYQFIVLPGNKCGDINCGIGACLINPLTSNADCFCSPNAMKLDDGTCAATTLMNPTEGTEEEEETESTSVTIYVLIALACLILILGIIMLSVYLRKRSRSAKSGFDFNHVHTNPITT